MALMSGAANAAPMCTTTTPVTNGTSLAITNSAFAAGGCVSANDKVFGTWSLGNLPTGTQIAFSIPSTNTGIYTISFNGSYTSGTTYSGIGFEALVNVTPNTITAEAGDFTQTFGGPSTLSVRILIGIVVLGAH